MKKAYEAPTIITAADAVRETKGGGAPLEAPSGPAQLAGSMGFNL
jgi:hypothetical protein